MENKRRSLAVVAILAVAAVAVIGAGFAAYWGQTEIADNDLTSKYISVATDDAKINALIEYDTLYSKSETSTPGTYDEYSSYKVIPSDYADLNDEVGFETGVGTVDEYNLIPLYTDIKTISSVDYNITKAYEFTLNSDVAYNSQGLYDFQVTLTGIDANIGSKVTLYFAYEPYSEGAELTSLTSSTVLYPFYPVPYTGTPSTLTYVCVINSPIINDPMAAPEAGFTEKYFGYIFADISGTQEEVSDMHYSKLSAGTAAPDVTPNAARLNVTDGVLQFQGMVNGVQLEKYTFTSEGQIKFATDMDDDFELSGFYSTNTGVATVDASGNITKHSTGSAVIVVELTHGAHDKYYELVNVNFS